MTIRAEASVGSAINTATTVTSATSSPIPTPLFPTTHTEINNIGPRTAIIAGVAVGVPLALLAAALAALLFYVKRKIRAFADGPSKKDLKSLVETIVRNHASYEGQAGEVMMKHTMTSAVNYVREGEEHSGDRRSHEQMGELDVGGRDDRAELV